MIRRVDDFTPEAAEDILELYLRFPLVTLGRLVDDFKVPPSTMTAILNRARQRRRWQSDASTRIAECIARRKLLRRSS